MKKTIALLLLTSIFAGCAAPGSTTGSSAGKTTALSAVVGCAAGAVLAKFIDGKTEAGCAAGAVLGAIGGYLHARQEELAEMRATAASIPGAVVETHPVVVADNKTGETKNVDAFKSLSVPLPASSLVDPDGRRVYRNLAALAYKNRAYATVTGGTATQRVQAVHLLEDAGLQDVRENTMIKTSVGRKGDIVVILAAPNTAAKVEV